MKNIFGNATVFYFGKYQSRHKEGEKPFQTVRSSLQAAKKKIIEIKLRKLNIYLCTLDIVQRMGCKWIVYLTIMYLYFYIND